MNVMGRVKNYHKYIFKNNYGSAIIDSKLVNIRRESLADIINSVRNGDVSKQELLPLPINKYSKLVGSITVGEKIKRGNTKQIREYVRDDDVSSIINHFEPHIYEEILKGNVKVFGGDWRYAYRNLYEMVDDSNDKQFNCKELIDGYFSRAGDDLILPKLNCYKSEYILGLGVNPKASSGYLTSRLIGRKRSTSTAITKPAAMFYLDRIMSTKGKRYILDKSLIEIGGREKRVSLAYDTYKDLKTRCIFQMEDIPTLISQSLVKPINESLQKLNEGFNYGGRINGGRNYIKYRDDLRCNLGEINFNCDFSGHDNRVQENAIVCGMAMLRLCYPEGEDIDRAFIYTMSSIIFKRVVLPESGLVYEISKGLATGHGFTSILTTICSFGTLCTAINLASKGTKHRTVLRMAGDDVTGTLPLSLLSDVNHIIQSRSGHKMDDMTENSGFFNSNSELTRCTFLKKKYNMFSWNNFELYINLINPTMKERGFGKAIDNIGQMILQAPFDTKLNNILLILYTLKIISHVDERNNLIDSEIRNRSSPTLNSTIFMDYVMSLKLPINPILFVDEIKFSEVNSYSSEYLTDLDINLLTLVKSNLHNINKKIQDKVLWFDKSLPYVMHKKTLRLAVFDANKKITIPTNNINLKFNTSIYNELG